MGIFDTFESMNAQGNELHHDTIGDTSLNVEDLYTNTLITSLLKVCHGIGTFSQWKV